MTAGGPGGAGQHRRAAGRVPGGSAPPQRERCQPLIADTEVLILRCEVWRAVGGTCTGGDEGRARHACGARGAREGWDQPRPTITAA